MPLTLLFTSFFARRPRHISAIASWGLVLASLLFLGACINKTTQNQELRFGLASMPSNLDPRFATDASSSRIGRLLFQKLVSFNEAKQPIPSIADWKKISDTHYRFTLNKKANNFHNGTTLTSADVKATYDFILNKENASPHRASIALIEAVTTPDEKTIDFHLSKLDPLFPGYLVVGIMPAKLIKENHDFNLRPIGSGPYQILTHSKDGKLSIERLSDKLSVRFLHVPNPTVRVLKMMRKEVDIVQNDLMPELIQYLDASGQVNIHKMNGSRFSYIGFNMEDPDLKNLNIRKAIAHGIDREEIMHFVFGNSARLANSILPPDHWAGSADLKGYEYNIEKAKALLAKFGYSLDKPLMLTYKTSSDPFRIRVATIYQHQLKKIGIEMDIRSYDWGTFYGDIKAGRFQLYSLSWIGIKTPDIFYYTSHSDAVPPNGANRGRYIDKHADELISKASSFVDLKTQSRYYAELQRYLLDQLPYIPLWYEDNVVITQKSISNYAISSDGNYDGLINVKVEHH